MNTSPVATALNAVDLAAAHAFRNLTMFPLIAKGERTPDYLTLDEAMAGGTVRITEVGQAGTVPELSLRNDGLTRVLLLDGEELLGAKQNRVLNLTILVPPVSDLVIPVSCVESGRWRHVSRDFSSSPRTHFAEGRAAKMRTVTESMHREGSRRSDQGQVWGAIAAKASSLGTDSETGAMADVFERHADRVADFDAPSTWQKLAPKLVRSYALDAIDRAREPASALAEEARAFMAAIAAIEPSPFPSTGVGMDMRLSSERLNGAALIVDNQTVHLSAFAAQG